METKRRMDQIRIFEILLMEIGDQLTDGLSNLEERKYTTIALVSRLGACRDGHELRWENGKTWRDRNMLQACRGWRVPVRIPPETHLENQV